MPLSIPAFVAKWQASTRTERSAAQEHYLDLCEALGQSRPGDVDPHGEFYTFERGAAKTGGGDGFADVWWRDRFAIEYKRKKKNLGEAYNQLFQYREDLGNPPLLTVTDDDHWEVHTNFTGTQKTVYCFSLADLLKYDPLPSSSFSALYILRAMFDDSDCLRPQRTTAHVTEAAAAEFAKLAKNLQAFGTPPEAAARFLMRLLFCLFAEDIGLLPGGLFSRLIEATRTRPTIFAELLKLLFAAMADGGSFGADDIAHFDGGLFNVADLGVPLLTAGDLDTLSRAAALDWASIEPAIFGTLFERSLDPGKRSQLGAHYTSRDDIGLVVEPVLMQPLRHRWAAVQAEAAAIISRREAASTASARKKAQDELAALLVGFQDEIARTRVLDPACGSGNFLYVALKRLLDLEKEVSVFAATSGLSALLPQVGPHQMYGIEVSTYAHELASIAVWIGYLQWLRDNGYLITDRPILKPLTNIQQMDAILGYNEAGMPVEPAWPEVEAIIGNPPFLGGKRLRTELGDSYVNGLFARYAGRVPREADLVTYWFERARQHLADGFVQRVGLIATQGIRGGANRKVLERIKSNGDIFFAYADRNWVLAGANVHVSIVGFDTGKEVNRQLDGQPVVTTNADLTASIDLTKAAILAENKGIAFMWVTKAGPHRHQAKVYSVRLLLRT